MVRARRCVAAAASGETADICVGVDRANEVGAAAARRKDHTPEDLRKALEERLTLLTDLATLAADAELRGLIEEAKTLTEQELAGVPDADDAAHKQEVIRIWGALGTLCRP